MNALTRFLAIPLLALSITGASAATFYPQPNPSNEEQYILELINAARANPAAEGQMLAGASEADIVAMYESFYVVRSQFITDFDTYAAKPPLAMNSDLSSAAKYQSVDQATNGYEGHVSFNGETIAQRINNSGYQWSLAGENVYAYVQDPLFGHVGLNGDWGVPTLDHRQNIMNFGAGFPTFKQVGISYVPTNLTGFGPYVLTEDFGLPADNTVSFLVGVVYNDANGNGAYDMGEGLAGVTITTSNGAYYTTTTAAGGYVLPLPSGSGTLTVTASGGALGQPRVKTITYGNATNVKVDFTTAQPSNGPALPIVRIKASAANLTVGGEPGVLTVARKGDTTKALEVTLATSGTAIPGVDCTALPKSVTIPAGAEATRIPVRATAAANNGTPTKKINIKLQSGAGYLVSSDAQLSRAAVKIWEQN
jgi:uncharacterized protein YkwD